MPIHKPIKYIFLTIAVFFQLYLAYASTLYLAVTSGSFLLVVLTSLLSVFAILYFVCVVFERQDIRGL